MDKFLHELFKLKLVEELSQQTPEWILLLSDEKKKQLAESYKVKGNYAMKFKEYEKAAELYCQAIQVGCSDEELMAALYNNGAAAIFHLGKFREALVYAERALALRGDYLKARWCAAKCAFQLKEYQKAEKYCSETIAQITGEADASQLLIKHEAKKLKIEVQTGLDIFQRLCDALKSRRIKFYSLNTGEPITEDLLRPKLPELQDCPVQFHIDNAELLIWPVVFIFPDLGSTIRAPKVPENTVLGDFLDSVLPRALPDNCPRRGKFCRSENLNVYTKNWDTESVHTVNKKSTIKTILRDKNCFVQNGTIVFIVVLAGYSDFEKRVG